MKYTADKSVEQLLSKVLSKWRRALLQEYKKYDITTEQWSLLMRLWEEDHISRTHLSHMTSKDLPTVTRILKKLETKELIYRKQDPNDLRTSYVCLTDKGKSLEDKLNPIAYNLSEKALLNIDKSALKTMLETIYTNLD